MTFIVAEIGVNHNGDISLAERLIDAAFAAGANGVKFQTFDPKKLEPPGERRNMLESLKLRPQDHFSLKAKADDLGLLFFSTPFDVDSLWFLVEELRVQILKISSGSINDINLLMAARLARRPVVLSTGMSGWEEIKTAVDILEQPALLHCVSAYPTPDDKIDLRAMVAMRSRFNLSVGLSHHTTSTFIPALAVVLGAGVIEKHFTLSREMSGPDHHMSMEPCSFRAMVENIRIAEASLGSEEKTLRDVEKTTAGIVKQRLDWQKETICGTKIPSHLE